jgi:hypothetical protein
MKTNKNKHVFFFFDQEKENEEVQTSKPNALIKRFVSLDFLGSNEISITNKIKDQLPQLWDKHFYLFDAVETMKIGTLDAESYHLQSVKELKDDGSALTWYKQRSLVYMDGYLRSLSCSRKYILFLTDFYRRLLLSIDLLVTAGLVHNNIGFKSIVVDTNPEIPILTNFRFGLDITTKSSSSATSSPLKQFFIQYAPERLQWPLEIHLLCYLQTNKLEGLSFHNIETVVKSVIGHNHYLKTFGQKIVDEYLESGLSYFSRYINKSLEWIVTDVTKYAATWDNYALSICYLKIMIDLYYNNGSKGNNKRKKSKFLIQFMRLLVGNIHSNPLKRLLIKDTTNKFDILMEECSIDELYLLVLQF